MRNKNNAIEVNNIKKAYRQYDDKPHQIKDALIRFNFRRNQKREIIKGISFEVEKGQALGLIGKNGCGKSTTLKMLTKIIVPDSGEIEINGRVSSLIELGAGFHPDMTGRENIYTNATIFGVKKREVIKRIQDIIDFSEIEEFIDSPVRTYSSGMYMRLAFSIAINVDADILLIDEILAVGDLAFQEKCFNKLLQLKKQGVTIILVSHSLGQVERLCDRAIWIDNGSIKEDGNPYDVNAAYIKATNPQKETVVTSPMINMVQNGTFFDLENKTRFDPGANGHVKFISAEILNHSDNVFKMGENPLVKISYRIEKNVGTVAFRYTVFNKNNMKPIATAMSQPSVACDIGKQVSKIYIFNIGILSPGEYIVRMQLFRPDEFGFGTKFDVIEDGISFLVIASKDSFYHLGWHEDAWGNIYIGECPDVIVEDVYER